MTAATLRRAPVAIDVAVAQLRRAGVPDLGRTGLVIDWNGPVRLDLDREAAVQAACGLMHVHGRATGGPRPLHVDYASTVAGLLGAQGVLAARLGHRRGLPRYDVRTSVAEAALLSVSQYLAAATADDAEPVAAQPDGAPPFVSADDVRFEIETLDAGDWQRFWVRLGADPVAIRRGWLPFQHRFATATCRLPAALHSGIHRVRYADVVTAGRDARVGVLPVRSEPDHPDDRPPWTLRSLPRGGRALPGSGRALEAGGPARLEGERAPEAGDRARLESGRGLPEAGGALPGGERVPPAASGPQPLDGVVVVESTRRVQGPLAGHVLRMLGADVIRVEPPGGEPMRGVPPMAGDRSARFRALNDGKRAVEADLKTPQGRAAVCELVTGADVFLHNWAPGRAARLGLHPGDLARVRPGLVYAHASGWGDALGADSPPGTDYLVQAHSGVAAAVVAPGEPPAPSLMTLTDVLGGLVSALGVLAGLLAGTHTGHGARVDSDLLGAAGVLPRRVAARPVPPGVPVCTDLRTLAADDRFAAALRPGPCVLPRPPWEFR